MRAIIVVCSPQECCRILNGDQSLLVRKTCPEIFKHLKSYEEGSIEVYIYCTKEEFPEVVLYSQENMYGGYMEHIGNGKVVAKFTLNKVEEIKLNFSARFFTDAFIESEILKHSCLKTEELENYLLRRKGRCVNNVCGYAWHIDNLEIFDKPKELSDFNKVGYMKYAEELYREYIDDDYSKCKAWGKAEFDAHIEYRLTKVSSTYCYVEM